MVLGGFGSEERIDVGGLGGFSSEERVDECCYMACNWVNLLFTTKSFSIEDL